MLFIPSAFPRFTAGRLLHHPFRGLLSVHSCCGLPAHQVATATLFIGGFSSFVTSTAAPIVTGWSDPVPGRDFNPLKSNAFSDDNGGSASFPINLPPSFTLYFWSRATAYGSKLDAGGAYNNVILGGEVYLTNGFRAGFTPAGLFSFWTTQSGRNPHPLRHD